MSKLPKPRIQMLTNISLSVFPRKLIPTKIHNTTLQKSSHLFSWWELQLGYVNYEAIRHRPFNLQGGGLWFFVSFRIFSDNTRVRILFFPEFNIRLYDKNSESDYFFFPPPKSEFFFSNIGNQNIFLEKNHNTPFKLHGPSLTKIHY